MSMRLRYGPTSELLHISAPSQPSPLDQRSPTFNTLLESSVVADCKAPHEKEVDGSMALCDLSPVELNVPLWQSGTCVGPFPNDIDQVHEST